VTPTLIRSKIVKEIHCGEFISGCPHVSRGETVEELMKSVQDHARRDHGMTAIDDNLRAALIRSIKER
jgi:predicted small metal-binding protein